MQRTSSARYARAARHFCLGATRSHSHLYAHAPRTPARGVSPPPHLSLSISLSLSTAILVHHASSAVAFRSHDARVHAYVSRLRHLLRLL